MSHHLLTAFPDLPPFGPGPSLTPHLGLSHSACPSSAPQPRTFGPQVSSKPSARIGLATGPLTKPRRGRGSGSRWGGQEAAWKTGQPTQKPCRKPPSHLCTLPPAPPPAACVTCRGRGQRGTPPDICPGPALPSGRCVEGRTNRGTNRVYSDQAGAPPWGSSKHCRLPRPETPLPTKSPSS